MYIPRTCASCQSQGGLFLWARLPEGLDTAELLSEAVKHKVLYVPGFPFFADPSHGKNTMRLNFSNMQPDQIEEGSKRLGKMLKKVITARLN